LHGQFKQVFCQAIGVVPSHAIFTEI